MAQSDVKQYLLLGGLVVLVIALSVGGTLYASGVFSGDYFASGSVVRKNMTLTDAQLLCENRSRRELGRRIRNLSVDDHSSRYDDFDKRFKVFFTADLYESESRKGFTKMFYINCYTRNDRELVTTFEVTEDVEFKPRAIRESRGGAFGFQ